MIVKLRAWDKIRKRMVLNPQVDYCDIGDRYGFTNMHDEQERQVEDFDLILFTGLQDKNGKEIWTGDIVKNYAFKDVVIFDKGIFTTKRSTPDKFGVKQPLAVHNDLEVIGIVWEHPELLGSGK